MIVTDERIGRFVGERIGRVLCPPFTFMGIEKDGEIVAGVVFNGFCRTNIDVTIAGHGWTRGFLREVGKYVFDQLGCIRMTAKTEQDSVVEIGKRLGGRIEGHLKDYYGIGRDATVIGILKHEYRYR